MNIFFTIDNICKFAYIEKKGLEYAFRDEA